MRLLEGRRRNGHGLARPLVSFYEEAGYMTSG
jgi:hypothetical protein